jgi:nucleoside phosphorylase
MSARAAVIFALYWELRPFAKRLGIGFFRSLAPVISAVGGDIVIARSGMGAAKSEKMAARIIEEYKPDLIISAGFCGALVDELKVGDVIVSDLKDRKLFCSPKPLFTCEEKTAAFHKEGAVVVDMESSGVAEAAAKAGVKYLAVKAVSDTLLEELPRSLLGFFSVPRLIRFRDSSKKASNNLSGFLLEYIKKGEKR